MAIAGLVRDYLDILIWPTVALVVALAYKDAILSHLRVSTVSLELFGISIETSLAKLERALTVTWNQTFDNQQWKLLEDIHCAGAVSVSERDYKMGTGGDLEWIRPLRNAGLLVTLPDGHFIEQAHTLVLSPLGRFLMDQRQGRATA